MKAFQTLFYREGFAIRPKYNVNREKRSISEKHKVANIFNKYFVNITKTLNIPVIQIKEKTNKDAFSFHHVLPWETYQAILSVNQKKSTSGTIPTKALRSLAKERCIALTDCINSAILNAKFPSELKMAGVI